MPLKSLHAHPALRLFRRMMPDLLVHLRDVANGCVRILFLRNQARLADVAGGDDGLEHAVFLCPNLDLVLMHCFSSLVDQPPPLATGFYDYYASFNTNLSPRQSFSPFFCILPEWHADVPPTDDTATRGQSFHLRERFNGKDRGSRNRHAPGR